jgi:hypothetical protein
LLLFSNIVWAADLFLYFCWTKRTTFFAVGFFIVIVGLRLLFAPTLLTDVKESYLDKQLTLHWFASHSPNQLSAALSSTLRQRAQQENARILIVAASDSSQQLARETAQLIRTELPESLPPSRLKRLQAAQAFWEEWYVKQTTHLVILKNLESLAKALRQPQDAQYYEKEALRIAPNDALATGGQP